VVGISISAFFDYDEWEGCKIIESVRIGVNVTSIGDAAFQRCYNLATVTFAEGSLLETIGHSAFLDCTSLSSITIPASVTYIDHHTFDGCTSLETVIVLATTPPGLGVRVFQYQISEAIYEIIEDLTIYVPAGSLQAYRDKYYCDDNECCGECENDGWIEYASIIQAIQ
jgi:hypothetical protein